jgi:hypothetical protein
MWPSKYFANSGSHDDKTHHSQYLSFDLIADCFFPIDNCSLNKATEGSAEKPILDLMENALDVTAVRNNGGTLSSLGRMWNCLTQYSDSLQLTKYCSFFAIFT